MLRLEVASFLSNQERAIFSYLDLVIETIKTKSRAFYFPPFEPAYLIIKDKRYYIIPNKKKLI